VIVVSDTSPVSHLHQIGRLSVLTKLYGRVLVPPAVAVELRAAPHLHESLDWTVLEIVAPRSPERVDSLLGELDRGESEAIVLALEQQAELLLMDERTGRDVASRLGIRRTGLLGVLLEAKKQGLISSVASEMDRLARETTFRIDPLVRVEVLHLAGE
jgi:hypothetical protein